MAQNRTACFVTPSYEGDFERCRLLVESRRACAPGMDHFIVVDAPDLAKFRTLTDRHTIVLDSREFLDAELHKLWGNNGWWFGRRVPPLRGWITQQLRKLAMPRVTDAQVLINVDSDVVFIRPFETGLLFEGGNLGLFEVDYRNEEIRRWSRQAVRIADVPAPDTPNNYVGMMIGWWSHVVQELTRRIEERTGLPWQVALARERSFSEYMLYGTYVRCGPGLSVRDHFPDDRVLVQNSWDKPTDTPAQLAALFASAPEEAVAVMVHSKDGVDPESYAALARRVWARG